MRHPMVAMELFVLNMLPKPRRVVNEVLLDEVRRQPCTIGQDCYGRGDPDHVTTHGAYGGDTPDNIMPLCRKHHTEKGAIGYAKMISKYPQYAAWLELHDRDDVFERSRRSNFMAERLDLSIQ